MLLEEILFNENDVVPIGTVIAKIRVGANAAVSNTQPAPAPKEEVYEDARVVEEIPYQPTDNRQRTTTNTKSAIRFYSPLVLNIAQQEGIGMAELENIPGTGQEGRVSKRDILAYVAAKGSSSKPQGTSQSPQVTSVAVTEQRTTVNDQTSSNNVPTVYSGNVEVIEMDRMRKLIAKHMVDSDTSHHVTSFAECDVTNLVLWREKVKKDFEKREGEKITFIFVKPL